MTLRAVAIDKSFGALPVLRGIDLEVAAGEFVALLGPSGSGKTTLLRIFAGLERQEAGQIFFGEEDMSNRPARERRVGFVFQHYALFRHMTVAENVGFGLRVRSRAQRPSRQEIAARVEELLELVQLAGLAGRYPTQLSGGQRQRAALARALANAPRVLLLDEPFGALDAQVRQDLRRWLRRLHDEMRLTSLFVTHDQEEALTLADRVAILNQGRIEQIGSPDEVYHRPLSAFACAFLGAANRLECRIADGAAWLWDLRLEPAPGSKLIDGPGLAFIRPQEASLANPGELGLPARVRSVFTAAAAARIELDLDSGGSFELQLDASSGTPACRPGEQVALRIATAHVFPV